MEARSGRTASLRACIGGHNQVTIAMALAVMLAVAHSARSFASGDAAHGAKVYQD